MKLGKKPAVRPLALSDLAVYVQGKLPEPPIVFSAPICGDWGMLGNDTVSDCTIAASAHLMAADNIEVGKADPLPTQEQAIAQYFAMSGGQDNGLVVHDVLNAWTTQGLFNQTPAFNKIAAYAPVNLHNLGDIQCAIAYYGGCYIGVELPASALDQSKENQPWTLAKNSPNLGGHAIVLVGYDQSWAYGVTWGKIVAIAYPWLLRYLDEAWAVISQEFVEAGRGPLNLDISTLQKDICGLR